MRNSPDVKVVDNYIHPECTTGDDTGNGVWVVTSARTLVQGNVIDQGGSNVVVMGSSATVVKGNYLRNPNGPFPRGTQVSVWEYGTIRSSDVRIEQNYLFSNNYSQEDGVNIGFSDRTIVAANYVTGGRSPSGCGILAADQDAQGTQVLNNKLLNTGQCGIGLGSGRNHAVQGNRVYNGAESFVNGGGNTAIYVWNQYPEVCGTIDVSSNIAVQVHPSRYLSGWWYGGGCDPTALANNVWNQQAITALTPVETQLPAPPVPPVPYAQRAVSPWSSP